MPKPLVESSRIPGSPAPTTRATPGKRRPGVYLNNVPTFKHEGTLHVFYGEKTMSVKDGLPKYKDMPSAFGGSGTELPE